MSDTELELATGFQEEQSIPFDEAKRRIISAQTLAFCQRCLGWQDAVPHHDGDHSIREHRNPGRGRIWFNSLDSVMPAAAWWCRKNEIRMHLTFYPMGGYWEVKLEKYPVLHTITEVKSLPHAIIMTCVEAVNILHDRGMIADTLAEEAYEQGGSMTKRTRYEFKYSNYDLAAYIACRKSVADTNRRDAEILLKQAEAINNEMMILEQHLLPLKGEDV